MSDIIITAFPQYMTGIGWIIMKWRTFTCEPVGYVYF